MEGKGGGGRQVERGREARRERDGEGGREKEREGRRENGGREAGRERERAGRTASFYVKQSFVIWPKAII